MLKWIFGGRAAPVTVDINEIYKRLDLYNNRYKSDPNAHIAVLDFLGQYSLRGSAHYGPSRSFYANPEQTIRIKAAPRQFLEETEEDEYVQSSACISFTEESLARGRRSFALLIRRESGSLRGHRDSVVFGIYGVYDRDGRMAVKKIMAPSVDGANRLTAVAAIPVTPENVEGALRYAELCAREMYEGRPFHPRLCLEQSLDPDSVPGGIKAGMPAP